MNPLQALLLGILQGATEFIPISSSGHLVLVPWLLHWPEPGLAFNALAHWGTLVAVLAYFYRDYFNIIRDWLKGVLHRQLGHTENARLGWLLIIGTVPGAVIGYLGSDFFEGLFSTPPAVSGFLVITAILLAGSETLGKHHRGMRELRFWEALLIGIAQGAAIAPGISRSGATIAVGLLLGLRRPEAARFSFLLSAPIVFGAGLLELFHLIRGPTTGEMWLHMALGFVTAAIAGYLCIRFLLAYLRKGRLYPFAVYCVLMAVFSYGVYLAR